MKPAVGTVYRLNEADYLYGRGPLIARVTRVIRETEYRGEPWWECEVRAEIPEMVGPAFDRTLYLRDDAKPALHTKKGD